MPVRRRVDGRRVRRVGVTTYQWELAVVILSLRASDCSHIVVTVACDHLGATCVRVDVSWYFYSCNTHCRAACNYRGTICGAVAAHSGNTTADRAVVKPVVALGVCQCDAGYVRKLVNPKL